MKQQIIENMNDPDKLENLYRQDQRDFEKCFSGISADYDTPLARFWKIRLAPEKTAIVAGTDLQDLLGMFSLAVFTAILVIIPAVFTGVNREFFDLRDLPLIALNGLILFPFRVNKITG